MLDLKELFEKYESEFLEFERVEKPLSKWRDVSAFLILESICQDTYVDLVVAAEHDQFWLSVDLEEVAQRATEEEIRDLIRCGVVYDDDAFYLLT